jgi:MoxR-like ATPase
VADARPRANLDPALAGEVKRAAEVVGRLLDEIERAVIGKRAELTLIVSTIIAGGHVLLDDLPGVAKTLTARSIATAAGLTFSRVQFTPDVLPSDITGATVLDLATNKPVFRPGPVFAQLVLADEINRAPAKTQAALLEAMQEHQVTADGTTHPLPKPFLVIATENPIESEGTYPLPEAQLDRFLVRTKLGYPSVPDETRLLHERIVRQTDDVALRPVTSAEEFLQVQQAVEHVHVDGALVDYIVAIVGATRRLTDLEVGSSPRGSLALLKVSRAWALAQGRDFVTPDDVRRVAIPALSHRVVLSAEAWARRIAEADTVRRALDSVAAPSWR